MLHKDFDLRVHLIRHGESAANTKPHLIGGRSPRTPLTAMGAKQAEALGKRFKAEGLIFNAIFTSTLLRAQQTARIMAMAAGVPQARIRKVPALAEFSQGSWEGRPRKDIYSPQTLTYINLKSADFIPPGGESQRMVERRVTTWLENNILWNEAFIRDHPQANIALVSHGIALKCLLHYALGFSQQLIWRIDLANCSISRLRFNAMGWHLESINDACHAQGLGRRGG